MRTRWWTPQGPGADSFDVVLADDPTVAGPFLALHRIGAAACEQAAATPLVDTAVLDEHIGSATDLTRVLLDSWVGKSDAGAYGRLLVRDLLTDARTGAQRLFAGLVSKGVAPPLAAERAGAVYGVPSAYVGRYREVAAAPGMTARVLADAADRTLFGYLARLLKVEQEDVAKATATPDDPGTTRWDARTAGGQFAPRVGTAPRVVVPTATGSQDITSWLQAQMDAPVEAPAPEVAKPKAKRKIQSRKTRSVRGSKPKEAAGPQVAATEPATALRRADARIKATRRKLSRSKLERVPVSRRQMERLHQAPAPRLASSGPVAPDVHKTIKGRGGHFEDLDAEVVVVADMAVAQELIHNSGGVVFSGKTPVIFRAGYLTDATGANSVARADSAEVDDHVVALAEQLPGAPPVVERISADDVAQWNDRQFAHEVGVRRQQMWNRYAPAARRDDEDGPLDEIHLAEDAATGDVLLVYDPAEAESVTPLNRVVEFHIHSPRAEVSPGRQEQIRLDPNQAYKIVQPRLYDPEKDVFQFGAGSSEVYDSRAGVWRVIYHLEPVDQNEVDRAITNIENRRYPDTSRRELGKAASSRDNPATTYHDARDATGRFTIEGQDITTWLSDQMRAQQETAVPAEPKQSRQVKRRKVRGVRRSPQSRTEPRSQAETEPATRLQSTRLKASRTKAERVKDTRLKATRNALTRRVYGKEPLGNATTVLKEDQEYAVVMPDQAQNLLATWHANLYDRRLNQTLPPTMRKDLDRVLKIGYGAEVEGQFSDAYNELSLDAGGEKRVSTTTFAVSGPGDPRVRAEAAILRGLMEEGTITSAEVREVWDDDAEQLSVEVEVYRSNRPTAPVVLFAFDKGVTLDNATGMRSVERVRSHQLGREYDAEETNPVSLDVYVVRITGPTPSERA